jgi:alcohol dehydrogenase
MRALVYHGPGVAAWEEFTEPVIIDGTDAIVRVEATTICGTDLHILKGVRRRCQHRRVEGHADRNG